MTIAALPETEAVARQIDPAAIDFLLVYAEALHRMGTPAHRLESELAEIAERLKVPAQFLSTPTSIQAAFGMLGEQHTTMLRMKPGATELGRLAELDAIGGDVFHSVRSPSEATRAVQALVAAPARFPLWAAVLADTAASAAAGRIFSTSPVDVLFGALAGLVVGLVRVALHGDPARSRLMVPLGAFGASFVAMLAASAGASPTIVTVSGILGLLPGFALTTAMTELGTGNLVSGTARAAGALVVLLELAFGVVLAQQLGAWLQVPTGAVHPALATALPGWTEGVALVAMIGGLHVLFQARPQDLRWVAAGAVVAYVASVTSDAPDRHSSTASRRGARCAQAPLCPAQPASSSAARAVRGPRPPEDAPPRASRPERVSRRWHLLDLPSPTTPSPGPSGPRPDRPARPSSPRWRADRVRRPHGRGATCRGRRRSRPAP